MTSAAAAPAAAYVAAPAPAPEVAVPEPEALHDAAPEIEIFEDELTAESFFLAGDDAGDFAPPPANDMPMTRPAILSEHAGRQVAAAFGELSDAFASRSKKTFDEMAEEMLRPMLQDWLDNNLPTLVERLVREEIERVARGAH
jgi:cell pole-organizing protein PopZ